MLSFLTRGLETEPMPSCLRRLRFTNCINEFYVAVTKPMNKAAYKRRSLTRRLELMATEWRHSHRSRKLGVHILSYKTESALGMAQGSESSHPSPRDVLPTRAHLSNSITNQGSHIQTPDPLSRGSVLKPPHWLISPAQRVDMVLSIHYVKSYGLFSTIPTFFSSVLHSVEHTVFLQRLSIL